MSLTKSQSELEKEIRLNKTKMEELETQIKEQQDTIGSQQGRIADTNSLIVDQAKEIEDIKNNPPERHTRAN